MTTAQLIKKKYGNSSQIKKRVVKIYKQKPEIVQQPKQNKLIKFMMHHDTTAAGIVGGTATALTYLPSTSNITQTLVLAILGAIASVITTLIVKKIWHHYFPKNKI